MSTDLGPDRTPSDAGEDGARTVTVLAPLGGPEGQVDLERPESVIDDVFAAVARADGLRVHQLVPLRRMVQPGPYVSSQRRAVELLDATTLEDVAAALGESISPLVHAVGWEAGVVAAALGNSGSSETTVVLEPLGAPGSPEWSLTDHAAALLVRSHPQREEALRHGVPRSVICVVPPASAAGPGHRPWTGGGERRMLAVVGDQVDATALAFVELLLRSSPDAHVVFAGEAAGQARERRCAVVVRSWAAELVERVHVTPQVSWPTVQRVDAVLDVGGERWTPRAALAAMATGRAVVALHGRPAEQLVVRGSTGLVVGADPQRTGRALTELLGADDALARMGAAGRERWQQEHSPEVRAARLLALYDRLGC